MQKYFILYMEPTSDCGNVESNGTPPGSSTTGGIGDGDSKPSVLVSLNRLFCNTAWVIIMYPVQPEICYNCTS